MKKILIVMMLMPMMALADTWTDPKTGIRWRFEISGGEATVGFWAGSGSWAIMPREAVGAVEIPSTLGGCSVTRICGAAFKGCSRLTSVTIPSSVTNIEYSAFEGCSGLTSVTIPSSVKSIGSAAFEGCSGLTSVTIPSSVIEYGAFKGCSGLTSVTIPSSVTSIERSAFEGCSGLVSFSVDPANEFYCSLNGLLCSKDDRTLIAGVNGDVTIPEGVTSIGASAFCGYSGLVSVTIPSSVTSIANYAFGDCSSLKDVYFKGVNPPSILPSSAGADPFHGCVNDLVLHAPKGWKGRSRVLSGVYLEVEGESIQQVNLTVTNVVVNYVLNSVQPEFAIPATSDTGFVNIITEVKGGAVAVPASWAENYPTFTTKFGSDFTKALAMKTGKKDGAGNDMFVWQDYVAGTDPTKPEDKFTASITVVEGKVTVSYTPELDDARKSLRKYTTWGKKSLFDTNWTVVQEGQEAEYNFFKVSVEVK